MSELRVIKEGREVVKDLSGLVPIELPKIWNEREIQERLVGVEYYVARDFTETRGQAFIYTPAKVYLNPKAKTKAIEAVLAQPYSKTQEEVTQESLIPSWAKDLISRIEKLEGKK